MTEKNRYKFTPILGWSVSRYDTFSRCKRQYYYQYYGRYDKDAGLPKINFLKSLTSIPLEIGNVTHDVIANMLKLAKKDPEKVKYKSLIDFSENECRRQLLGKEYFEEYYKQKNEVALDDIFPKVKLCLDSFRSSAWKSWLFKEGLKEREKWIIEPGDFGETRVDGLKAYLKVDFMFPKDDRITVLDWKTGKKDLYKHGNQLVGYTYYAMQYFGAGVGKIDARLVYLGENYEEEETSINEFDISRFEEKVKTETGDMYKYCGDVENNVPLGKDEFRMTENLNICRFCNYKELCGRE
ncbi:MAG: PD-(D/E)XK nuclease family protein [bacterium]|nr:PD-(D/E)XK nuclease family protein [bacterium]